MKPQNNHKILLNYVIMLASLGAVPEGTILPVVSSTPHPLSLCYYRWFPIIGHPIIGVSDFRRRFSTARNNKLRT